ncbi:MAG: type II toxin-antitoxin system VapC family toxin [Spirochaetales bacterium]|nr:type II toxin-antitoxin system VapC family toxin [Spirochaetales bacterium]
MVVFLDTSALAKRYIEERGSGAVDSYFHESNDIRLSPVTPIEIASIFRRRFDEKSLSLEDIEKSRREWEKECSFFLFREFDTSLTQTSIMIVDRARIKTLDAIQLASAYLFPIDIFVTADKALAVAAEKILNKEVVLIE